MNKYIYINMIHKPFSAGMGKDSFSIANTIYFSAPFGLCPTSLSKSQVGHPSSKNFSFLRFFDFFFSFRLTRTERFHQELKHSG